MVPDDDPATAQWRRLLTGKDPSLLHGAAHVVPRPNSAASQLAAIGLVPLLAGTFDVCVFSRLFGGPFSGSAIRACAKR